MLRVQKISHAHEDLFVQQYEMLKRHVHLVVLFRASAKLIDLDDEVIDVIFFDNYRWNEHLFI